LGTALYPPQGIRRLAYYYFDCENKANRYAVERAIRAMQKVQTVFAFDVEEIL